MENDEDAGMEKDAKKIFDNLYAFGFFVIFLIALIFTVLSFSGTQLKISFISKIFGAFSSMHLLIFTLLCAISTILAYLKKYNLMFLPLVIWLLFWTASARSSNISNLIDVTTGNYTLGPDLDPFLYLRHANEILKGELTSPDIMRYSPLGSDNYALHSLMPWAIVGVYKFLSIFKETTLTYAAIISPVIFFTISALGFLLFVMALSSFKFSRNKSWIISIIATAFYVSLPAMLHRTVAGIPEIESLGMMWIWFAFLFFVLAWKQENQKNRIFLGIVAGIFTGLMVWSWGGYKYIYLTFALTSFLIFLFEKDKIKNIVIFSSWLIPSLIIKYLKTKDFQNILLNINDTGIALVVLFVMTIDYILFETSFRHKLKLEKINLPNSIKSVIIATILLFLILFVIKPGIFIKTISSIIYSLLYPFGKSRVGSTIAENTVPYFSEIFANFKFLFWTFFVGIILLFYESIKHFKSDKKIILNLAFILFLICFIFSRISPQGILNGENFISKLLYLGSLIFLIITFGYVYIQAYLKKDERTIYDFKEIVFPYLLILIFSLLIIISMRGAVRLLFIVGPVLAIISAFLPIKLIEYKREAKDEFVKFVFGAIAIIVILIMVITFVNYSLETSNSAKSTIPSSYTQQWQRSMSWVRENTTKEGSFIHWWDYGYWVQSIGERATITDGGHFIEYWDHLTGRYLLTTPYPETALSIMKTYNASYLLIDSTDLGKYAAYSKIGGDKDNDRFAQINTFVTDKSQIKETSTGTIRVFQGGIGVDEDIIYEENGSKIFIPGPTYDEIGNPNYKSFVGGIILETIDSNETTSLKQPEAVFIYNNQQIKIPMRYIYLNGEIKDFEKGIDAVFFIFPNIDSNGQGEITLDNFGASIYLSPRVSKSLFAKLYLLDDVFNEYIDVKLVHSEDDSILDILKKQGVDMGEFIYYQGFRGPIKIWEVSEIPKNILIREEFLRKSGEYAEFDNLNFSA